MGMRAFEIQTRVIGVRAQIRAASGLLEIAI